ncbi:MAG: protein phosphatase 2C domain-containing protein [Tannerella sp.]|jgi:serine/threonine protein phosphatase PrpC|nr:protein phosphatase 2C domain-containing protein [Tannerella sp.]
MITGTALPDDEAREKARDEAFVAQIKSIHISFPNGKVNCPYAASFDAETLLPEVADVRFEGLEAIGLQYDTEQKQIKGLPSRSGDHKITLQCKRKDRPGEKPPIQKALTIIINPNPRSLWNKFATPLEIEYYKPDEDKEFVKVKSKIMTRFLGLSKTEEKRKDMVAASQRGRSHAHEGRPRDDDFALHFDESTEWYTMVVADGAGSAKFSRRGSQIACQTVIEICKTLIPEQIDKFEKTIALFEKEKSQEHRNEVGKILYGIIGNAAFKAYKSIEREAASKGNPMKDYATTLLLSICKKFDFGWFIGAFWVGDGGIGVYRTEPPFLKIMGEPDGGEFAGQTRFLTMPEIMQATEIYRRLRFDIYPDFTALVLMTDGVTDPKFETDANLSRIEKWHALWEDLNGNNEDHARVDFTDDNEEAAGQLLKWLDFWSKGNHDDRTIAILF